MLENLLNNLKCLYKGHVWVLALSDRDGETTLPNGETVFGALDLYACFRCGKVKSTFVLEKDIPEDEWDFYN